MRILWSRLDRRSRTIHERISPDNFRLHSRKTKRSGWLQPRAALVSKRKALTSSSKPVTSGTVPGWPGKNQTTSAQLAETFDTRRRGASRVVSVAKTTLA
jgi:hypothetical protein